MNLRRQNPILISTMLTVAALICLGLGSRLLITAGDQAPAWMAGGDGGKLVGLLTLIGGAVVFLLSTIAILAARRYAVAEINGDEAWTGQLELSSIKEWSQDLANLRDDLRRDGYKSEALESPREIEVGHLEISVPQSWQAKGNYLIDDTGATKDRHADLKVTRDQLLEAAARVDDIVQSINATTSQTFSEPKNKGARGRWWHFFRN